MNTVKSRVKAQLRRIRGASVPDHGHAMLMRRGLIALSRGLEGDPALVEVGSTREDLPGQGSTAQLADFATQHGLHFTTVDMDPENTERAERTLRRRDARFRAVSAKGEEFLASETSPLHLVYLDAFDVMHQYHSEERKRKYSNLLGTDISDEGAAAMHLACAEAIVHRVVAGGVVVFDDTWLVEAGWGGKGATAVPFLLKSGYFLDDVDSNSVALVRVE